MPLLPSRLLRGVVVPVRVLSESQIESFKSNSYSIWTFKKQRQKTQIWTRIPNFKAQNNPK